MVLWFHFEFVWFFGLTLVAFGRTRQEAALRVLHLAELGLTCGLDMRFDSCVFQSGSFASEVLGGPFPHSLVTRSNFG